MILKFIYLFNSQECIQLSEWQCLGAGQVLLCLLFTNVNCCLHFKSAEPSEEIGHFRVPLGLCFKTRVGAQTFVWKSFFILIFTRKVVHLASFSK